MEKSIYLTLFSVSVFLAVLLAVNYAAGIYRYHKKSLPYGLSFNAMAFEYTGSSGGNLQGLLSLEKTNLVVLLEKMDGAEIGLYDPGMVYYSSFSTEMLIGSYRYFSQEDYAGGRMVGVSVAKSPMNLGKDQGIISSLSSCPLADKGASVAWNLFALEPEEGDMVYADSNSKAVLKKVRDLLLNEGYEEREIGTNAELDLTAAIRYGLTYRYSFYLLFAAGTMLLFHVAVSCIYMENNRKRFLLHALYGGKRLAVLKVYGGPVFLTVAVASLILGCLFGIVFSENWHLTAGNFFAFWTAYLAYTLGLYFVNFGLVHLRSRNRRAVGK